MPINKLSPTLLIFVLICFCMPFFSFSCEGRKAITLTGIQLATGTSIESPQVFGPPQRQKIDNEPLAAVSLLSAIVALGLCFLKARESQVISGACAGLSAILLLALKSKVEGDALRQAGGVIQMDTGIGYYLALALLLVAAGTSAYGYFGASAARLPNDLARGPDHKFCPQCGARNAATVAFCQDCGAKFDLPGGVNA